MLNHDISTRIYTYARTSNDAIKRILLRDKIVMDLDESFMLNLRALGCCSNHFLV